jgi:aminoglycoside phosphotransferase (APT) family kinase protein
MQRLDPEFIRQEIGPWLEARIPGARRLEVAPVEFPTAGGRSAESSFIDVSYDRGGQRMTERLVMRREFGNSIFLGSGIQLPWNMMRAMRQQATVPVPECVAIEPTGSLLSTPFLLMRRCPGQIAPQAPNYNLAGWVADLAPEQRATLWRNGIEMIARVHDVDWREGFEFLDDPAGGERGLREYLRWLRSWYNWAIAGRSLPLADAALAYLEDKRPERPRVDVLWGDAAPHNLLFNADLSVSAVLDWETARLGPGETDLAWWLFFDELMSDAIEIDRLPGLPDSAETIAIYEAASGRQVEDMDYYAVLSEFRMMVVSIRASDRRAGTQGSVPCDQIVQTPAARMLARRLGLPIADKGPAYETARSLLGRATA